MPAKNFIDITNQRFGRLIALKTARRRFSNAIWQCQCDCGNITFVSGTELRKGHSKSCGCLQKELTSQRRKIDISNQRFGKLVVLKSIGKNSEGGILWRCKCECGNITSTSTGTLRSGAAKSCGCSRRKDMSSRRFGRLLVLEPAPNNKQKGRRFTWKCLCDCGKIVFIMGQNLRGGITKSCGCLWEARNFTRGTRIDPYIVPLEIIGFMKANRELKKAIKQAS